MRRTLITTAAAVLTTGALVTPTSSAWAAGGDAGRSAGPGAAREVGHRSLAQALAADGSGFDHDWKDFDILEKAVLTVLDAKPNSPVKVLTQGGKRLTAFLPTDQAFRKLVKDLAGKPPKTEKATFEAVASVADVDTLETVLLYHVVPGATLGSGKVVKADGAKLDTAAGKVVKVRVKGKGEHAAVKLVDRDFDDRNARVVVVDINKGNKQIGHAVNRVLRPIDL